MRTLIGYLLAFAGCGEVVYHPILNNLIGLIISVILIAVGLAMILAAEPELNTDSQ